MEEWHFIIKVYVEDGQMKAFVTPVHAMDGVIKVPKFIGSTGHYYEGKDAADLLDFISGYVPSEGGESE